jgi:hypothetical protein
MSMRGEVQTTKTILYPMAVNLGKVYIGVPVVFEITIENICNLPSKFKFERPGGEDPNAPYRIEFRPLRLVVDLLCFVIRYQLCLNRTLSVSTL